MAVNIELKRSAVPGKVPSTGSLNLGEIAINTYDGKAYFKKDDGTESIIELATTSGSSASASYALSASYAATATSASYAVTASYILTSISASYALSSSFSLNTISASYAATASSADNFLVRGTLTAQTIVAQYITSSTEFITGSTKFGTQLTDTHQFTGSVLITGSLQSDNAILSGSFQGNLTGTSSYADNANSASYALNTTSASYADNTVSASYALNSTSASYAKNTTSASYTDTAISASYALNADLLDGKDSTVFATTGSNTFYGNQILSGSTSLGANTILQVHGFNDALWAFGIYNDTYSPTQSVLAGWVENTGEANIGTEVNKPLYIYTNANYGSPTLIISSSGVTVGAGGITGSLYGTASWANNATTASYALTASYSSNSTSASYASNATSASYALNTTSASYATSSSFAFNAENLGGYNHTLYPRLNITNTFTADQQVLISSSKEIGTFEGDTFYILDDTTNAEIGLSNALSDFNGPYTAGIYVSSGSGLDYLTAIEIPNGVNFPSGGLVNILFPTNITGSLAVNGVDYINLSSSFNTRILNNSASISTLSSSFLSFSSSYNTGSFNGSFTGSFTGSVNGVFSGSLNNLQGSPTYIPFFSSSQVLSNSSMYQIGSASIAINETNITTANPEALYVSQTNPTSINVISGKGNLNNYLQLNIFNTNQGISASSDIVATANNGNEFSNYIDMGINSENYTQNFIGGPNDAYLYSTGNDLHIGNAIPGKLLQFFAGGTDVDVYNKLQLSSNNQHIMSGSLDVSGSVKAFSFTGSLLGTASFADNATSASFAFSAISASYANNSTSASYALTASYAINSTSASYASNATSASYVVNATSASYASNATSASYSDNSTSASYALNATSASFASSGNGIFSGSFSGSFSGDGSGLTNISASSIVGLNLAQIASGSATASISPTAGFVVNTNTTITGSTVISGSLTITGSTNLFGGTGNIFSANVDTMVFTGSLFQSGSITVVGNVSASSFTGSLFGTASYAANANSASYALNATSASYALNTTTSSYSLVATSASYANNATSASYAANATSASYAATSSYASNFTVAGTLTAQTIIAQYITSSTEYITGSTIFGSQLSNTHQFTGSVSITGSLAINGVDYNQTSASFDTRITNNSASIAALSSSYLIDSASFDTRILNNSSSISTLSSSFLVFSGSYNTGSFTGSFIGTLTGTASWANNAISASYALNTTTASYAVNSTSASYALNTTSASYVLSASYALNADLLDGKDSSTFATTGSNIFIGNQTVTGSLFTTGSNTLIGLTTLTGSLNITGSTTQTGDNTLIGNTVLSGSIIISGSQGTTIPSVQIYGDIRQSGYHRFDPVTTNIDTSISASYIYVSGSTKDLYFSQNGSGYNNVTRLRWLEGTLFTGLLNGGLISASIGSTTYTISSGSGIVVSLNASYTDNPYPTIQYVSWGNITGSITALSASYDQQFVAILSDGTIGAQGTPYENGDYNTKIPIGIIIHQNRSTINAYQTFPSTAYGWKQRSSDFVRAFGPLKITGYTLTPSGSSTRGLLLSGGTSFVDGRNYTVDPNNPSYINEAAGITTSKIFRYYQSGSAGWKYDTNGGVGYTAIDPTQYSLNGVLTPVPANDFTIQRVFYFPNSATKAFYIYYGNATYANETAANAAIATETFNEAPNTAANAIYIGYMTLRNNADFTVPASFKIYPAGLFRGGGSGGAGGGGGATTLSALSDVLISSPTSGQALVYNSVDAKWENKSFISASISGNAATATSASFATTASYVLNAQSASYALNATSASYVLNSTSASYALNATSASFADNAINATTASYILNAVSASYALNATSASYALNATSASYAATSSYASNFTVANILTAQTIVVQTITSSIDFVTGSTRFGTLLSNTHQFTGSVTVTGSLAVNDSNVILTNQTSSMSVATASYVLNAVSASYSLNSTSASYALNSTSASYALNTTSASYATQALTASNANTASYVLNAISSSFASTASFVANAVSASFASTASFVQNAVSSSFATTASFAVQAANATSASYAATSSYADNFTVAGTLTAQTIVVQTITSSTDFVTGSTRFGSTLSNTHQFTGSVSITGSLTSPIITGSLFGTASWANNAITASNANTASYVLQAVSASFATTASFAVQAANAISASFASNTTSASFALTASFVPTSSLVGNFFVQGGNSFGTQALLGTNDTQNLAFETNGSTRVLISGSTGHVGINTTTLPSGISPAGLSLGGSAKSPAILTTFQHYSPNISVDQGIIGWNYYWNGSALVRNNTSFTAIRFAANPANSDVNSSFFVSMANTAGADITAFNTSLNTGGNGVTFSLPATASSLSIRKGNASNLTAAIDVSGSVLITGSLNVTTGITGSLFGTASWASNAVTASNANTASYVLNAVSASYAATSSFASSGFTVGISQIKTARVASSIAGSNNLFTDATGSYTAAKYLYTVTNGANARTGEVIAVWNGGSVQFTDNSTLDIGSTTAVTSSVAIVTAQAQFNIQTNTSGWTIKSQVTYI